MQVTEQQTQKLLSGSYTFAMWSLSMLITRLKGMYAKEGSAAVLRVCTGELNGFLQKYGNAMGGDYAVIQKL